MRKLDFLYSPLLKALGEVKQDKAPAQDWLHILKRLPGVKQNEQHWMDLDGWLDERKGQQVTRDDLMEYVRANQIQLSAFIRGEFIPHEYMATLRPTWDQVTRDDVSRATCQEEKWTDPFFVISEIEGDCPPGVRKVRFHDDFGQGPSYEGYQDEKTGRYTFGPDFPGDGIVTDLPLEDLRHRAITAFTETREAEIDRRLAECIEKDLNYAMETREQFEKRVQAWDEKNAQIAEKNAEIDRKNAELGYDDHTKHAGHTEGFGSEYIEIEVIFPGLHEAGRNHADSRVLDEINAEIEALKASRQYHVENDWDTYPGGYSAFVDRKLELSAHKKDAHMLLNRARKKPFIQGSHFPEENIVVHIRAKTRLGPDGEKILFIEEIQSDLATLHREASEPPSVTRKRRRLEAAMEQHIAFEDRLRKLRNDHFNTIIDSLPDATAEMMHKLVAEPTKWSRMILGEISNYDPGSFENKYRHAFIEAARQDPQMVRLCKMVDWIYKRKDRRHSQLLELGTERKLSSDTPDTPFKEELTYALASKVALRWAAENDFDGISWTPAWMQAERWSKGAEFVIEAASWDLVRIPGVAFVEGRWQKNLSLSTSQGAELKFLINEKGEIVEATFGNKKRIGKTLADILPGALAKRVMNEETGQYYDNRLTMKDSGFVVGYDNQTPKAMQKFVSKFGSKVEQIRGLPDFKENKEAIRRRLKKMPADELLEKLSEHKDLRAKISEYFREARTIGEHSPKSWVKEIVLNNMSMDDFQATFPELSAGKPVWHVKMTPQLKRACLEPIAMFREQSIDTNDYVDEILLEGIRTDLEARMCKLGLKNVELSFDTQFEKQGAVFDYGMGELELLIGRTLDPVGTIDHEAVHILKTRGLFTHDEWEALSREAEDKWIDQYAIRSRYPDAPHRVQVEEAIAEAYADYTAEERHKPLIRRAFNKVRVFFRALSGALGACHVTSPEQVFRVIESGKVGRRNKAEKEKDNDMSLPAAPAFG